MGPITIQAIEISKRICLEDLVACVEGQKETWQKIRLFAQEASNKDRRFKATGPHALAPAGIWQIWHSDALGEWCLGVVDLENGKLLDIDTRTRLPNEGDLFTILRNLHLIDAAQILAGLERGNVSPLRR